MDAQTPGLLPIDVDEIKNSLILALDNGWSSISITSLQYIGCQLNIVYIPGDHATATSHLRVQNTWRREADLDICAVMDRLSTLEDNGHSNSLGQKGVITDWLTSLISPSQTFICYLNILCAYVPRTWIIFES